MIDKEKITPLALSTDMRGVFIPFNEEIIVMQYTSLKDKDEKEAFEGDIVDVGKGNIYFIEFRYGEFRLYSFRARNNGEEYSISIGAYLKDSEIIGNIYQNPKLLEKNHE